ncbi:MAG: hypothetical protein R2684_14400 [Pyrinomonadaceae bacterium]
MKASELLTKCLERPALYVGYESVTLIKAFVDGYIYGYEDGSKNDGNSVRDPLYSGFQDWVSNRFKLRTEHDWASIITFMGVSDTSACRLAKKLWKKYREQVEESQ